MHVAAAQIEAFHRHQVRTSWFETTSEGILGQLVRPIERVGIYAPGGTAVYPSSLLMTAVPAGLPVSKKSSSARHRTRAPCLI